MQINAKLHRSERANAQGDHAIADSAQSEREREEFKAADWLLDGARDGIPRVMVVVRRRRRSSGTVTAAEEEEEEEADEEAMGVEDEAEAGGGGRGGSG